MSIAEIAQKNKENIIKTFNRQPHEFVPVMSRAGSALLDYAGTNLWETRFDREKFLAGVFKAFEDGLPADYFTTAAIGATPELKDLYRGCVQTTLQADGITTQHLQNSLMTPEDYPEATKGIEKFLENVMIPRKMPWLFEIEVKEAAKILEQAYAIQQAAAVGPTSGLDKALEEKFGSYLFADGRYKLTTPGDVLFDNFRGFKGMLTDCRRHLDEMSAFCDQVWEERFSFCRHYDEWETMVPYKYANYNAHVPAFLSTKQYEILVWKYFKQQIENMNKKDCKLYLLAEGTFMHVFDLYRDLPKDSMIINVEQDDIFKTYDKIGDWMLLVGGTKVCNTRLSSIEENKDLVKKAIDYCAPGNAFIFGSDKSWCCKGDVTPTLVETFKFAKEYGKY